jgi:hypothetical protein
MLCLLYFGKIIGEGLKNHAVRLYNRKYPGQILTVCMEHYLSQEKRSFSGLRFRDSGFKGDLALKLQKSRMPQIQGVKGEAVVLYREPLTTQEMWDYRLSRRVKNMAFSSRC